MNLPPSSPLLPAPSPGFSPLTTQSMHGLQGLQGLSLLPLASGPLPQSWQSPLFRLFARTSAATPSAPHTPKASLSTDYANLPALDVQVGSPLGAGGPGEAEASAEASGNDQARMQSQHTGAKASGAGAQSGAAEERQAVSPQLAVVGQAGKAWWQLGPSGTMLGPFTGEQMVVSYLLGCLSDDTLVSSSSSPGTGQRRGSQEQGRHGQGAEVAAAPGSPLLLPSPPPPQLFKPVGWLLQELVGSGGAAGPAGQDSA
ncbi:hypothetical protein V8C86DRAFT_2457302 [Haematococcus lacustris]